MAEENEDRIAGRKAGEPERWDAEVLNAVMATPQGRFWMERLLDFAGSGRPVYLDDGDALGMAKRDGKADVGRYLEAQLEQHCPDQWLRMIRERRARIKRAQEKIAREERRKADPSHEHSGMTAVEELADQQRAEAEAEAARSKQAKPKE